MSELRVRFAPSPTGDLHLGNIRTGLYNWLHARAKGGTFVLRIEDTDLARSTEAAKDIALEGMAWLGMHPDEGPYFQSARTDLYARKLAELEASGGVYRCWCTKDELDARRAVAERDGGRYLYERTCRDRAAPPSPDAPYVLRARIPIDGEVVIDDVLKGLVEVRNDQFDDFVVARTDGTPIYNFVVVVDDIDMRITHVIRGEDHLSNTPKQIHLYDLLGAPRPLFAHLPMIHGPDGKKLGKRHGAASILAYRDLGYLPEVMISYLARLGWSHGDQEVFTVEQLFELFDVKDCGRSASTFDAQKLDWQNGLTMRAMSPAQLLDVAQPFLAAKGLDAGAPWAELAVSLFQPRADTLVQLAEKLVPFWDRSPAVAIDSAAAAKFLTDDSRAMIGRLASRLAMVTPFESGPLEEATRAFVDESGLKLKHVGQPVRVALMGDAVSPPIFDCMQVFGRDVTLARLRAAAAGA
jgi:glutamyl-tRNA synthetase